MAHKYILLILIFSALSIWSAVFFNSSTKLQVIACDVGQGDAILIESGNTQILVDGGPDSSVLACLGRYMSFWDRKIELVVATHADSDHITGLTDVIDRYEVEEIWTNELGDGTQTERLLKEAVGGSGVKVVYPKDGTRARLGLMYLDVVNPEENALSSSDNNKSIVFSLRSGNFKALFTGDMEIEAIERMIRDARLGDVDYLKVSHHGSKNGTTQELIQITSPEIAVISVGEKNRYGHPNQEVLDVLLDAGAIIQTTAKDGDIKFTAPGEH